MHEIDALEEILNYGLKFRDPIGFCPRKYWFSLPECVQVAADTYRTPIEVYDEDLTLNKKGELTKEPFLVIPFEVPKDAFNSPYILYFCNNNHWNTLKLKKCKTLNWPPINYFSQEACQSLYNHTEKNLRKKYGYI